MEELIKKTDNKPIRRSAHDLKIIDPATGLPIKKRVGQYDRPWRLENENNSAGRLK